jgi:hypothetical protein
MELGSFFRFAVAEGRQGNEAAVSPVVWLKLFIL